MLNIIESKPKNSMLLGIFLAWSFNDFDLECIGISKN